MRLNGYSWKLLLSLMLFLSFYGATGQTPKRGLGMSTATTTGTWYGNIINSNSHWYYTWGTTIPTAQEANMPPNSEFVPMFWGAGNVNSTNINKLITLKNQGKIKYVLGFNEPDLAEEANMTVDQALNLWPQLESIGLPLVSPATSYPSLAADSWFVRFMDGAQARNLRVDYIAVHLYVGGNPGTYIKILQDVYARYGKPIWITEFAVRDDNTGGNPANNIYTPEMILAFMENLLPQLEALPFVFRYAWFNPSPTMAGLWPCALFNQNGSLTILGDYYKSVPPFGYTIFEAENATLSGVVKATQNSGFTGTGYGDYINNTGDYIQWTVNVPQAGVYPLAIKYAQASGNRPLELRVNGNVVVPSLDFPSTGSWTSWKYTSTVNVTLNSGNNLIRTTSIGSNGGNLDHLLLSQPSNLNPVVAITSPAHGASFSTPVNIALTASASDPDGTISKVEFFNGAALIGSKTSAPFTFTWANVAVGNYSITAKATDNNNAITTSAPVSISVTAPAVLENLALNKTITASSIQGGSYAPTKANDGVLTSRWSSASSDPQWIMVDIGSSCTISQVVLNWQNASGKNYTVEVSNDPTFTTKTTVATVTNGASGANVATFNINPVNTRYVRMYGTARNTSYGYSLFEFEVYGSGLKSTAIGNVINNSETVITETILSPNPVRDVLNISIAKDKGFRNVSVFNVSGIQVYSETINSDTSSLLLGLSHLPTGLYFIKLERSGDSEVHKFFKE